MRLVRADGAHVCIASPNSGRSPCLSGPCQCPFLDGGPAHSGHSQDIGVDFGVAAKFTQNNPKKVAGCDARTSHPAIAELRKVQHGNFAPCDNFMSHPATLSCRTLRHRAISPCHFRLSHSATRKAHFRPLQPPFRRTRQPFRHRHWPSCATSIR